MTAHNLKETSIIAVAVVALVLRGGLLCAQMDEVDDADLSQVYAQAGINYNWGDSRLNLTIDSIGFSDTDHTPHNWLTLEGYSVTGPDGYFTYDANYDPDNVIDIAYNINYIDVGTMTTIDDQIRSFVLFVDATNTNPRTISVDDLVFCTQSLGSIEFDMRNEDPTILKLATHGEGGCGLEFEYLSDWLMEDFTYAYNTSGGALNVSGIHIAGYASGDADDPSDPSTWEFSGRFSIGDLYGGNIDVDGDTENDAASNPATMDVATIDGTTCVYMNLPMKGTIRAEEVNFGSEEFGPVAIDGLTVHHLYFRLNPGE
ncbi:MAG TPA: hypothetical protein PKY89_15190 [Deltaproteobacteria bacterium]|nr:hypothetical protein [Deltaproteobacteria bacterium]